MRKSNFSTILLFSNVFFLLLLCNKAFAQDQTQNSENALPSNSYQISFLKGKADLLPSAKQVLDKIAVQKAAFYEIAGYADKKGDEQNNLLLSQERAEAVSAYLKKRGVAATTVEVVAFGEKHLLPDAQARKVTITLHQEIITTWKKMQEKPQVFMLKPNRDTVIFGKKGTKISIPAGSFNGAQPVKIVLKEFYSRFDMWLNGLTTQSDSTVLESAGVVFLGAEQQGKTVKPLKEVSISFTENSKLRGNFDLYNGTIDKTGHLNWHLDRKTADARRETRKKNAKQQTQTKDINMNLDNNVNFWGFSEQNVIQTSIIRDISGAFALNYDLVVEPDDKSKNRIKQAIDRAFQEKSGLPLAEIADFQKGICTATLEPTGKFKDIKVRMNSAVLEHAINQALSNIYIKPYNPEGGSLPSQPLNIEIVFTPASFVANRFRLLTVYCKEHKEDELAAQKLAEWQTKREKYAKTPQEYADSLYNAKIDSLSEKGDIKAIVNGNVKQGFTFPTRSFGYLNCDAVFSRNTQSREVTLPMSVIVNDSAKITVTVIGKNANISLEAKTMEKERNKPQEIVVRNLPRGEAVWVVATKEENGRAYLALTETIIDINKPVKNLVFEIATPEKLRRLAALIQ